MARRWDSEYLLRSNSPVYIHPRSPFEFRPMLFCPTPRLCVWAIIIPTEWAEVAIVYHQTLLWSTWYDGTPAIPDAPGLILSNQISCSQTGRAY